MIDLQTSYNRETVVRLENELEQVKKERNWLAVNLANAMIGRDLVSHLDELGGMSPPDPETLIDAAREATQNA